MCEICEEAFENYKKIRAKAYEHADEIRNREFEEYKKIRANCKDKLQGTEKYGQRRSSICVKGTT